jgi:hypothetical protein
MTRQVCTGALLTCAFGQAPARFVATPRPVRTSHQVAGVITDHVALLNIPPFGLCGAPSNPQVEAATRAALGVPTPMPCLPVLPAPWLPGAPTVRIHGIPALDEDCSLQCAWGGRIGIAEPGQSTHLIR